jgi:hypothetical protein
MILGGSLITRYLVRQAGEWWLIVDRQRGFVEVARCGNEATADWLCCLMNESTA